MDTWLLIARSKVRLFSTWQFLAYTWRK